VGALSVVHWFPLAYRQYLRQLLGEVALEELELRFLDWLRRFRRMERMNN
jgi:hypothetical protein